MKVNCMDAFNIEKLREGIERYIVENVDQPYAFMSKDTLRLLVNITRGGVTWYAGDHPATASFEGIKIYIDDNMSLGVVELR